MRSIQKWTFFILLAFALQFAEGQDMVYYYSSNHKPVNSAENANFVKKLYKLNKRKTRIESFTRVDGEWKLARIEQVRSNQDGYQIVKIKTGTIYADKIHRKFSINAQGDFDFQEYADGNLVRTGTTSRLLPLHLKDTITEYFRNGKVKSIAHYENNSLVSNKTWLKDGTPYVDSLFYSVDKKPTFEFGQKYFNNYILKSLEAQKVDLSQYNDKVILGWVITDKGDLKGAHVLAGQYVGLGKLLSSIIEDMPGEWEPAKLNGEKVNYFMQFPVNISNNSHMNGFDGVELTNGLLLWY